MEAPLLKITQGNERMVRVSREGKASVTDFTLVERLGDAALVEARLGTGRTHQIRVHSQFGGFRFSATINTAAASATRGWKAGHRCLCLHARSLVFRHLQSGETIKVNAPLDEDFEAIPAALRSDKR